MLATVYRLENPETGLGAFEATPWEVVELLDDLIPNYMDDRPMPYNDGPELAAAHQREGHHGLRYGCADLDGLRHWFPPEFVKFLPEFGVELTVWRVPPEDLFRGRTQVAFKPDRAERVETRPVASLHSIH